MKYTLYKNDKLEPYVKEDVKEGDTVFAVYENGIQSYHDVVKDENGNLIAKPNFNRSYVLQFEKSKKLAQKLADFIFGKDKDFDRLDAEYLLLLLEMAHCSDECLKPKSSSASSDMENK